MKIDKLTKKMGDFSLSIDHMELAPGKVHGLIGSNGSGKTTLVKLIMGILDKDGGTIDTEGLTVRDITMTSQRPYLLHDTVYENLIYPLKIRKIRPDENEVMELLGKCGLADKRNRYARSLSSGEQQKLSFLRAMVFHPKMILVDETLSNLDPDSAAFFSDMILEQQQKEPITWILISHQLAHIARTCDEVHFMAGGRLITEGTPEEVLKNPSDEAVRRYLADTEVSFPEFEG